MEWRSRDVGAVRAACCGYFATVRRARYACRMTIHKLFPTFVYSDALQKRGAREFNRQLLKECRQLRHDDAAGRRWSAENYPGGYTSYGSVHWLQRISPTFKALQSKLERHVLCARPGGHARDQIRGPAAGSFHGGAAAQGHRQARNPPVGNIPCGRRRIGALRELAAA